jgi:hypothetical protein
VQLIGTHCFEAESVKPILQVLQDELVEHLSQF